jgi:CubicO group peptidase (beta-lactamase class C family)
MTLTSIERRLLARIVDRLPGAAPGLLLQVYWEGRKICDISAGETYPYYDLASLTKIVFTVPALMLAFDKGLWTFGTQVDELWPGFPATGVKLKDLLTHSGGALWWYPFYKEIDVQSSEEDRRVYLKQKIQSLDWMPTDESVYSDVGMLTLGFCLETLLARPLIEIWKGLKAGIYSEFETLDFHPGNRSPKPRTSYAPTEMCAWRGRLMQGEVHDENAWALGGVSSHAGLFGGIGDLSGYGLLLRSGLLGISKGGLRSETLKLFAQRARPAGKGDWGLGFMKPAASNSSCGDRFSEHSLGHTGFTGTSLWYDPGRDLLVAILSNRVFFGREHEDFKKLRPMVHNWVVEELS